MELVLVIILAVYLILIRIAARSRTKVPKFCPHCDDWDVCPDCRH